MISIVDTATTMADSNWISRIKCKILETISRPEKSKRTTTMVVDLMDTKIKVDMVEPTSSEDSTVTTSLVDLVEATY